MNNLWYSFRELRNNWLLKLIILIQIFIAIILLYRVNEIKNYENDKMNMINIVAEDKRIYKMAANYQSAGELFDDTEELATFAEDIMSRHDVVVSGTGNISMKEFNGIDQFIDTEIYNRIDNKEVKPLKSLLFSENIFELFEIKLSEGSLDEFEEYCNKEFTEGNIPNEIPVILGPSYKGIFNINDLIKTDFTNIKVVGFLEENQFFLDTGIYDPTAVTNLNNFIIQPMSKDLIKSNITSGVIVDKNNNFNYLKNDIEKLAKINNVKVGLADSSKNIDSFKEIMKHNANINLLIVYIVVFFVVIGLVAIFSNRLAMMRKEFSIHIMHGATYSDIYIRIFLEHMYLVILAIINAAYYLNAKQIKVFIEIIKFNFDTFFQTILVISFIIGVITMIPIYTIRKNKLNYLIKGE